MAMKLIYAADTFTERIAVFSQGELADSYGSKSTVQLACPAELTFPPDGYLYVINRGSQSLQVFTANGRYVEYR